MKVLKTYSIEDQTAQEFADQTPPRKTSQELEKLMKQYIGENDTKEEVEEDWTIPLGNLTSNQEQLLAYIYRENLFGVKLPVLKNKVNKELGIYTRKHQWREVMDTLQGKAPVSKKNNELVAEDVECGLCGDTTNLSELSELDGVCLCGEVIVPENVR